MQIFKGQAGKNVRVRRRYFLGFDTETDREGNMICAALYGFIPRYYGEKSNKLSKPVEISAYFETTSELHDYLRRLEQENYTFTLVAHNCDFDSKYLIDILDTSKTLYSGSRFVSGCTKGGTELWDTMNFFAQSLDSLIKVFGLDSKYGIVKREGYLDSDEGKRSQVLDDARAVYYLMEEIQGFVNNIFGVSIRRTASSTALKVFKDKYFSGVWYRKDSEAWKNDFERKGYYGGRVEVFRRGKRHVKSYDVHSMYVSILRDCEIPNPSVSRAISRAEDIKRLFEQGEYLMMDITVHVPEDSYVGLLPYRGEGGKLIFPVGVWRGVYPSVEVQFAVENGAEILDYHYAIHYPEKHPYFHDYAIMTIEGRKKAKRENNKSFDTFYKLLGNGLYGKFGQKNYKGGRYIRFEDAENLEGCRLFTSENGIQWVEESREGYVDAIHTFPVIPAFVTAFARVRLGTALVRNAKNIVYCDTDSVKVDVGISDTFYADIGDEIGQFGFEYEIEEEFLASKCYGKKRKGIPGRAELLSREGDVEVYRFEKPIKFKSSIRRKSTHNKWEEMVKSLTLIDTKRHWIDNDTSAPHKVYSSI